MLLFIKHLEQCQVYSKYSIHVSHFYYATSHSHPMHLSLQPRVKASRIIRKWRSYLSVEREDDLPSIKILVEAMAFPSQDRGEMGLLHFPWQQEKSIHIGPE